MRTPLHWLPLVTLASLAAAPALAGTWYQTPGLQPLPGSAAAAAQAHHQAEANRPQRPSPPALANSWLAANFQNLAPAAWEITHQDITVELQPANSKLKIAIVVDILAHEKTTNLSMLMGGVDSAQVKLAGVDIPVQNQAVSTYSMLQVALPEPLTPDTAAQLHLDAEATLECGAVGIGLHPCGLGSVFNYVAFFDYYVSNGEAMHSPFTSELHVVTPSGQVAAAPGGLVGTSTLPDGRVVTTFHQPERTDNAGFALAPYQPVEGTLDTGVPVHVYGTAGYSKYLPAMRDMAIDVIGFYGKLFVPFPWASLNIIQVENDFGGGYSPLSGVFMLRDEFTGVPGDSGWQSVVELAAHEYAHQWWGNLVAPQTNADVALSESLAEYSSCFYTEAKLGNRSQVIRDNISYMYQVPAKSDLALGTQGVTQSEYYVQIVYYKGAAVLDMLRHTVGDDVMAKGLAKYATDFGRDFARIDDLRAAMEAASGTDLGWFFSQWFTKKFYIHAELRGQVVEVDSKPVLRLHVTQPEKALRFVVPVSIDYRGGKTDVVKVDVNAKADFVTELPLTAWPVRVRFDVQRTLIRQFAVGTPGDFNLSGLADGADLVELALRHGRGVVVTSKKGTEHFFADTSWNELYDLTADGRIDSDDVDAFVDTVGTEVEPF